MDRAIYYLKASRKPEFGWEYDWDNFPTGETQEFATFRRNALHWKTMRKGDIVIGHSSFITTRKGKKINYIPKARISAIGRVVQSEHHSKRLDTDAVSIQKVVEFRPVLLNSTLLKDAGLQGAEPFKPGTNRCTITSVDESDYLKIIELIKTQNPGILRQLKEEGLAPDAARVMR